MVKSIEYSDAEIAGMNEFLWSIIFWDKGAFTWSDAAETCSPSSAYIRDPIVNSHSVPICHLTRFGLFGESKQVFLSVIIR